MISGGLELWCVSPIVCRLPAALILSEGFAFWRAGSIQRAFSYSKHRTAWESQRSSLCLGFKVETFQAGGGVMVLPWSFSTAQ